MSTRTKDGAPGKVKRGTSPSPTAIGGTAAPTLQRRSSILDSTPSGKSIPGYLKPTISSAGDASKVQAKKPVSSAADSALARRRSFDKPPSPSRLTKSLVSPTPGIRTSFISGKISTDSASNKPALSRRRSFDKPPSPSHSTKSSVSPSPDLRSSAFSGKVGTESAGIKPALSRRRSFDKPPSASPSTKSPVLPNLAVRSSTRKTGASSQKGVSERNLKGPKDARKSPSSYAKPASTVKKSSALSKKHEPGSGSSRKERVNGAPEKVEKPIIHDVPETEPDSDQESVISEEQIILVGNCNEKESEDLLLEDQEEMNMAEQTEGESNDKDAKIVSIEPPAVLEQQDDNAVMIGSPTVLEEQDEKIVTVEASADFKREDASAGVNTEEPEDKTNVEEISSEQEEKEDDTTNEMNGTNNDQIVVDKTTKELEDKGKEKELDPKQEHVDNEQQPEKEKEEEITAMEEEITEVGEKEVDGGSELKEKQVQEVVSEEKNEDKNATPGEEHGKKDTVLSNDTIEETANKLIEQRRNKVKALAGAFESVINL